MVRVYTAYVRSTLDKSHSLWCGLGFPLRCLMCFASSRIVHLEDANLDWMPDGRELWEGVESLQPTILTGLPMGKWAEPQKVTANAVFDQGSGVCRCGAKQDLLLCLNITITTSVLFDSQFYGGIYARQF